MRKVKTWNDFEQDLSQNVDRYIFTVEVPREGITAAHHDREASLLAEIERLKGDLASAKNAKQTYAGHDIEHWFRSYQALYSKYEQIRRLVK
jgi:hypothetical protein